MRHSIKHPTKRKRQRGAAILTAMLLVTLVASLSAAALWQQWRGIEIETAERERLQSAWILRGALDWARLILREDARAGTTDHLAEPWAVALQEARLSTFLASAQGSEDTVEDVQDAFLSGQISDLQARLNVMNLVQEDGAVHQPTSRSFSRLFTALNLPEGELLELIQNLKRTQAAKNVAAPQTATGYREADFPLQPQTIDQLAWLGLSAVSIDLLRPYTIVLPERTTVNLNTAPALVLHACIGKLSMADAQRLVSARALSHFRTLSDVAQVLGSSNAGLEDSQHGVNSRYFEIRGQLRLDTRVVQELSVVHRDGLLVKVLWRERGVM